ncbi:Neurotrypsin [Holothuria leucospilota]|uniref:Neurotrypsin n=1 Tax=Holothuria leucospilota TaxID=206669 RepID=A0A9Q1BJ62_HOLLE|nr:Neurotrypsin [Holothuria leucospilota]
MLDNVECVGDERKLEDCIYNSWNDCYHNEDAGLLEGKPRLVDGNSTAGRVEICLNERWGTVCDHNWDMRDADVVCRELGFKGADAALLKAHFGQGQGPVYIEEVECFGNEISIFSCNYTDSTNCEHEEDAGVNCIPNRAGDVRLVDGNSTYGLVEAYVADNWATVCGRNWGLQEAAVTCRQLGFKDALFASNQAPKRNSSMAVDQVNCTGGEKSLLQCKHKNDSNCRYLENAFVACIPGENFPDQEGGIMETQRPLHQGLFHTYCTKMHSDRW